MQPATPDAANVKVESPVMVYVHCETSSPFEYVYVSEARLMVGQDGPVTESEKAGLVDDPATLCGGAGETVPTHVPQAPGVCALSVIAPGSLFCTCSGPVDAAIDATGRLKKAAVATAQTYSCLVASMVNLVVASDTGQNRNAVSYGGRSHRVRSVSPIETELVLLRGHRERIDRSPEDFHEPDACTAQLQLARTRGVTEAREVAGASRRGGELMTNMRVVVSLSGRIVMAVAARVRSDL